MSRPEPRCEATCFTKIYSGSSSYTKMLICKREPHPAEESHSMVLCIVWGGDDRLAAKVVEVLPGEE